MIFDTRILWLWLHLIGVIFWAGGFFYLLVALAPALGSAQASEDRKALIADAVAKFRRVSWIAIAIIVVSGIMNLMKRMGAAQAARAASSQPESYPLFPEGYMGMVTVKVVIVLVLIVHQAVRLMEPRVLDNGRIGFKSKPVSIVSAVLFLVNVLLGIALLTM